MRFTYALIFVLFLPVLAFSADQKHPKSDRRDKTTYRENTRPRRNYDLPRTGQANQSAKDLQSIEKQLNRTPATKTSKTTTPKPAYRNQQVSPHTDRNVPMDFQYHPPKGSTQRTQATRSNPGRKGVH